MSLSEKTQNVRRLEAQRNELNAKVRLLREELQLLQEQGSHVGEVIKPMDKKKVLVKVEKYSNGSVGTVQYSMSVIVYCIYIHLRMQQC